jgi:hypothetical protein
MKYDDASWHYGGKFPKDLPLEAGATHTGMFVAWALLSGLAGDIHVTEFPGNMAKLRTRVCTPGKFFLEACDGKFTDEDLNDLGNDFARIYYDFKEGQYLSDYEAVLGKRVKTLYHVKDTWKNYENLKPILDQRFEEWRRK